MKKSDTIKLLAIDEQPDNLTALTTVVQKALIYVSFIFGKPAFGVSIHFHQAPLKKH